VLPLAIGVASALVTGSSSLAARYPAAAPGLVAQIASSDLAVGYNRLTFGLIDHNHPVEGGTPHLQLMPALIAAIFGVIFVPQILAQLLPQSWQSTIGPYVPMEAGSQIVSLHHESGNLGAWSGFGVFCLYAAIALALAVGFFLIDRRDA